MCYFAIPIRYALILGVAMAGILFPLFADVILTPHPRVAPHTKTLRLTDFRVIGTVIGDAPNIEYLHQTHTLYLRNWNTYRATQPKEIGVSWPIPGIGVGTVLKQITFRNVSKTRSSCSVTHRTGAIIEIGLQTDDGANTPIASNDMAVYDAITTTRQTFQINPTPPRTSILEVERAGQMLFVTIWNGEMAPACVNDAGDVEPTVITIEGLFVVAGVV